MNSARRQVYFRKFTLEHVIEKLTNIDSDDESLADALEPLTDFSSDDEVDKDNVIPEGQRCCTLGETNTMNANHCPNNCPN